MTAVAPVSEWSVGTVLRTLLTPDGLADPYRVYREIRAASDAGRSTGRVLFRHRDVRAALGDRDLRADRVDSILRPLPAEVRATTGPLERTLRDIIVFRDPPDHTRLRRLLTSAFSPRVVSAALPAIAAATDELLDGLDADDVMDLHGGLTYPLPAIVVAALLGIPAADRDAFRSWALDLVMVVGSGAINPELATTAATSMTRMRELMDRLVSERRARPGPDLLSAMIEAADGGDRLTGDELCANALFLMTAGHETATNMLSNGILTLLRHPDQLNLLRANPSLLDPAIEEILRYEGPVQIAARIADRDRQVAGLDVRAGQPLIIMLGAANRDPDAFDRPDTFDITRSPSPHVAFSHGMHFCLGAALARAEAATVLPRLLARFPVLRLADEPVEWQPTLDFRGPQRLPLHGV